MKISGVLSALLCLTALAGCNSYPRDIEGTSERVAHAKQLRVGYGQMPAAQRALAERFAAAVAARSGVQVAERREASDEALFAALDANNLDLVVTEVATDSPWLTEVAVIEPLATRRVGKRELGLSPVVRNGENRWVMTLEREVRSLREPGRAPA